MKMKLYAIILSLVTVICVSYGIYKNCFGGHWDYGNEFAEDGSGAGNDGNGKILSGSALSDSGKPGSFEDIKVSASVLDVTVKQGTDFTYEYTCSSEMLRPTVKIDGSELRIEQKSSENLHNGRNWRNWAINSHAEITVTVPQGTKIGRIDMDGSVGDIRLENIEADDIKINGSVGDCKLDGVRSASTDSETSTGSFKADNCELGEFRSSSSTGECEVKDSSLESADINTSTGGVDLNLKGSENDYYYDLSTSVGDIDVDGADIDSDDEDYNTSKTGDQKLIKADTSVGGISISFD